jgi:hypothetical protein
VRQALAWLQEQGVTRAGLHATDPGRPLSERAGFAEAHAMRLALQA